MDKKRKLKLLNLLKNLKKIPGKELPNFISSLSDESIDNICECVYNVIHTDLNLNPNTKKALKRKIHKCCKISRLKKISNKNISISKRKEALKQEGKGLPILLAAAIPFLTNLLSK